MQQAEDPLGHSAVTATTTTATQPLVVDDAALAAGPGDVAPTSTAQAVAAHETTSTIMPATSTMPSTSTTPLQVPVDTVPRVQPQRPLTATDPLVALASQLSSAAAVGASRPSTAGQFHHSMSTPSRFPLFGGGGGHGNLTLVTGAHALLFGGGGSAGNLSQPASAASMTAAAAAGTITTAGTAVAQAPVPITHREVAQYLIGKDYLLTALEFYTELCEDGREVRELRDYFANHRNFELGAGRYHATGIGGQAAALTSAGAGGGAENHHMRSMSDTYSSMNETISTADEGQSRMSNSEQAEALREKDEYIAVLEYELRQAKDMAEKLKTRLSNMVKDGAEKSAAFETLASAADSRPASQLARRVTDASLVSGTDAAASTIYNSTVPVQPQERRILNYLVNEYLQTQCFKMSALTFADENDDQDLEDWEDVIGVPKEVMPPPPNVLALYRSWKYGPQEQMVVVASVPQPGAQTNIAKENQVNDTKLDEIAAGASLLLMPPPLDAIPETSTVPPPAQNLNSLQTAPTPSSSTTTATRMPQRPALARMFRPEMDMSAAASSAAADSPSASRLRFSTTAASGGSSMPSPRSEKSPAHKLLRMFHLSDGFGDRDTTAIDALRQHPMTDIVGSVLPALIPNVLINKREELLPLLVAAIVQQSNVEVQRTLVGHLLHLIKRPDLKQRHAICDACLSTIDHSHSVDLIESIIHHCAELASHKFSERRVLAAELCGQLVPYVEGTSTAVQVLAVLASLAGEAHPEVRFVVVKNLCVLVGHVELNAPFVDNEDGERNAMGHSSDVVIKTKSDGQETVYRKIRSLTLDFLCDDNVDVARVAQDILLPVLLDHLRKNPLVAENANVTAAEVGLYGFAQSVLNRLSILTQPKMDNVSDTDADTATASSQELDEVIVLLKALDAIVLHLFLDVLISSPLARGDHVPAKDGDLFENQELVQELQHHLDEWLKSRRSGSSESESTDAALPEAWPAYTWVADTLVRYLLVLAQNVVSLPPTAVMGMVTTMRTMCMLFGSTFADVHLCETMEKGLGVGHSAPADGVATKPALFCVYTCGVLTTGGSNIQPTVNVVDLLRTVFIRISTSTHGWMSERDLNAYRTTLVLLSSLSKKSVEQYLQVFIELTDHPDADVRLNLPCIAALFVPIVGSATIQRKILPWLNQLSNDSERSVRLACIQAYMPILEFGGRDREILEKIEIKLSAFLDDPLPEMKTDTLMMLASKSTFIDDSFRDSFILPTLLRWTTMEMRDKKPAGDGERLLRVHLVIVALHVYRSFCDAHHLVDSVAQQYVVPALVMLDKELSILEPEVSIGARQSSKANLFSPLDAAERKSNSSLMENAALKDDLASFGDILSACRVICTDLMSRWTSKGAEMMRRREHRVQDVSAPLQLIATVKNIQASMLKRGKTAFITEQELDAIVAARLMSPKVNVSNIKQADDSAPNSSASRKLGFFGSKLFQKFQTASSASSAVSATTTPVIESMDQTMQAALRRPGSVESIKEEEPLDDYSAVVTPAVQERLQRTASNTSIRSSGNVETADVSAPASPSVSVAARDPQSFHFRDDTQTTSISTPSTTFIVMPGESPNSTEIGSSSGTIPRNVGTGALLTSTSGIADGSSVSTLPRVRRVSIVEKTVGTSASTLPADMHAPMSTAISVVSALTLPASVESPAEEITVTPSSGLTLDGSNDHAVSQTTAALDHASTTSETFKPGEKSPLTSSMLSLSSIMPTNVRREDDGEPPVLAAGVLVHPLAVAPKHLRTIEEQTAPSTPFFKPQPTARVAFDLMLLDDPAVVAVDTEAVHEPFVPAERTNFFDFDDDRVTLGGTANAPDETMALETSLLDSDVPADLQITAVHEEFGQLQRADSDELSMASAAMGLATAGDEDNVIKSPPPPPSKNFFDDEPAMAATAPSNVDFLLGTEVPSASSASGRKTEQGETGGESQ